MEWNTIVRFEKVGSLELSEMPCSQGLATNNNRILEKKRLLLKSSHQVCKHACSHACFHFAAQSLVDLFEMTRARWSSLVGRFRALRARTEQEQINHRPASLGNRLTEDIHGVGTPEAETAKHICCLQIRMTDRLTSCDIMADKG